MAYGAADIDRLFTEYSAGLCLYARHWLGSNAEDAVQEAFVKLLGQSSPPGNVKAWLYRTVRNECISRLRKKRVRDEAARTMQANGRFWFVPDVDAGMDCQMVGQAL
ncbi:MAG: hypothetical protein JXM68_14005, partial [Sedimentisphaerales bacterium]|nr:hypothetical protein [Sedimentisphaerales bacterium]